MTMNTLRKTLSGVSFITVIPFALLLLVLLYCVGGRAWREFLTGRDLEHD